jgi:hypothetical protein
MEPLQSTRSGHQNPKPFTWTADPDAIIEKVRRGNQVLESIHSHVRRSK